MPERAGNSTNNATPLSITIDVLTLKSPAIYLVHAHDFRIITLLLGSNEGAKVDSGVVGEIGLAAGFGKGATDCGPIFV
jgi:hypothetical protein